MCGQNKINKRIHKTIEINYNFPSKVYEKSKVRSIDLNKDKLFSWTRAVIIYEIHIHLWGRLWLQQRRCSYCPWTVSEWRRIWTYRQSGRNSELQLPRLGIFPCTGRSGTAWTPELSLLDLRWSDRPRICPYASRLQRQRIKPNSTYLNLLWIRCTTSCTRSRMSLANLDSPRTEFWTVCCVDVFNVFYVFFFISSYIFCLFVLMYWYFILLLPFMVLFYSFRLMSAYMYHGNR